MINDSFFLGAWKHSSENDRPVPGKGERYNPAERTELNGADTLERARG